MYNIEKMEKYNIGETTYIIENAVDGFIVWCGGCVISHSKTLQEARSSIF
jgi:hypothetical protein